MPPSLRRRGQPPDDFQPVSDSDEAGDAEEELEEDVMVDEEGMPGEVEDDDEGEGEPGSPAPSITHTWPIPPSFREISTLASWTVSSSKPGCSIPQLRSQNVSLFWQSDGPQPHYLNIHFFKLVRIVGLRLYLDFEADESYTPTKIIFLAGSGANDLVEWGEMKLEQPRGWVWADFSGVGEAEEDEETDDDSEDDDEGDVENDVGRGRGTEDLPGLRRVAIPEFDDDLNDGDSNSENEDPVGQAEWAMMQAAERAHQQQLQQQHQQQQETPTGRNPATHEAVNPTRGANATPLTTNSSSPAVHRHRRTHPRLPLHSLTPNASPHIPSPKRKKVKTPVLRAHLVQIKILENHQNGKDTHLRGLQIFAKDNEAREGARSVRVMNVGRKGRKSMMGGDMDVDGGGGGLGLGGLSLRGLTRSSWDVEPSIR